jgi:hypothetical protein
MYRFQRVLSCTREFSPKKLGENPCLEEGDRESLCILVKRILHFFLSSHLILTDRGANLL